MKMLALIVLLAGSPAVAKEKKLRDCKEAKGQHSLNSNTPTTVIFVNHHDFPLEIYWLDFEGKRKFCFTIGPGERQT
jgi:hypothetical protein